MISPPIYLSSKNLSYIAGTGTGIVTALGKPASRQIFLIDAKTMIVLQSTWSKADGRYIFIHLDANKEYIVMARDYKRKLEPFVWDYVKPANDLTLANQQAM